MKKYMIIIALLAGGLIALLYPYWKEVPAKHSNQTEGFDEGLCTTKEATPLYIVYFQDVSGSIKQNGVEIVTSEVFSEYYSNTRRDIELSVGVIGDQTAHKLITLTLPAIRLCRPDEVDYSTVVITDRKKVSNDYKYRLDAYEADSALRFNDRAKQVRAFRAEVDSLFKRYRHKQAGSTDLLPAVTIADKVFNYSAGLARNVLIINSDAKDSRHRKASPLKNRAIVILVNANGSIHTDLDSVVTINLQSTEKAVSYSLNHN